ncbi:MAG TPA: hypothetical protein VGG33_12095 [Polyangia bacterium]
MATTPRLRGRVGATLVAGLTLACTPDIDTDPLPEAAQFEPTAVPPRVSEPSFLAVNPATGRIDLSLAGVVVPPACDDTVPVSARAQCEFNQYLQSLDGFPTTAGARTPMTAPVDLASVVAPQTLAVFDARTQTPIAEVAPSYDAVGNYLQVAPKRGWPVGSFIWLGLRGYEAGIRAGGKPVVASVTYNLLKREAPLTCAPAAAPIADPAAISPACPYYQLLSTQPGATDAGTRASLLQLEQLRQVFALPPPMGLGAWALLAAVGGIPKAEAAVLWGFPVHSAPVIDLDPNVGLAPRVMAPDEIHLGVNGTLAPETVKAFRIAESVGSVYFMNLAALGQGNLFSGFPPITATYAGGSIVIKTATPLSPGLYGVVVTRDVKSTTGAAMVSPPISVLLMARGPLVDGAGKSLVSSVSDANAAQLELGRQQLAPLLENPMLTGSTWQRREQIAYLYAFAVGASQ